MRAKPHQLCPILCDPMDYSPPGSPLVGFFGQEYWSGISSSMGMDALLQGILPTQGSKLCVCSSCIAGRFCTLCATRKAPKSGLPTVITVFCLCLCIHLYQWDLYFLTCHCLTLFSVSSEAGLPASLSYYLPGNNFISLSYLKNFFQV